MFYNETIFNYFIISEFLLFLVLIFRRFSSIASKNKIFVIFGILLHLLSFLIFIFSRETMENYIPPLHLGAIFSYISFFLSFVLKGHNKYKNRILYKLPILGFLLGFLFGFSLNVLPIVLYFILGLVFYIKRDSFRLLLPNYIIFFATALLSVFSYRFGPISGFFQFISYIFLFKAMDFCMTLEYIKLKGA